MANKIGMRKTSIDLPKSQYDFLVQKAVDLTKQTDQYHSMALILRALVDHYQKNPNILEIISVSSKSKRIQAKRK